MNRRENGSPAVLERSIVIRTARSLRDRVVAFTGTATGYARSSYIYQWLTKEPEPEVIVIDLRETRTVGPFIRLLDAGIERVGPYWNESRVKRGVDSLSRGTDHALQTRPGRVLVTLLEPPDPPESKSDTDEPEDSR